MEKASTEKGVIKLQKKLIIKIKLPIYGIFFLFI